MEATIDALVDVGWGGTTTTEIARRSGLTRGAQQHHFANKADLMVGVTVYSTNSFYAEIRQLTIDRHETLTARAAVDIMWRAYTQRRAIAQQEMWLAARTDPHLRAVLRTAERSLAKENATLLRSLFSDNDDPQIDTLIELTVEFVRGLALHQQFGAGAERVRSNIRAWAALVERTLTALENGEAVFPSAPVDRRRG